MTDLDWAAADDALGSNGLPPRRRRPRPDLIGIGDPRWGRILAETNHDIYHVPTWVALDARIEGGSPRALLVEDGGKSLLLPLVIRSIPGGGLDATSPYGYPGPLMVGTDEPAFMADALDHGIQMLRSEGIISMFIRTHPLLNPAPPPGVGTAVRHGDTIAIDLTLADDLIWSQTRKDHRRSIRRSLAAGHRVRVDTAWEHFETFKRLYAHTMTRVNADAYYFFTDSHFDELRSRFPDRIHLIVVEIEGEIATAALELETCGIVQDYLAGTDERFLRFQPDKLMLHFVRSWARQRGNRWLHLGGGVGANDDSLLHFKAGFSRGRYPYYTVRVVLREQEYKQLVAAMKGHRNPTDLSGFFPAYRDR